MPFEIVRNDITCMEVDAVVNTASRHPVVGPGVDLGIHKKAGPRLLEAREAVGYIPYGQAAITPGFDLKADWVIHTAGPRWEGGLRGERELLRSSYQRALELAAEKGCESIAFPLISTGNRGVPEELSMEVAQEVFRAFLKDHEIHIYLVAFGKSAFRLSEELFRSVSSYIDEHYVTAKRNDEMVFPVAMATESRDIRNLRDGFGRKRPRPTTEERAFCAPMPYFAADSITPPQDLDAFLKKQDSGFAETLLDLIKCSGMKQAEVYKKANVDRRVFSKIINDKNYRPSKPTAVAFAVALKLDMPATRDLVERAGYSLTRTNKFDLIIEYCLVNQIYDVFRINEVLFEFDQVLLGNAAK